MRSQVDSTSVANIHGNLLLINESQIHTIHFPSLIQTLSLIMDDSSPLDPASRVPLSLGLGGAALALHTGAQEAEALSIRTLPTPRA